jgi:hemolysin D
MSSRSKDVTAAPSVIIPLRRPRPLRRRRDELEFLPAALEIMETPPSPTARVTALVIIALVLSGIGWACIGRIDTVTAIWSFMLGNKV